MNSFLQIIFVAAALAGCAIAPLRPGTSSISPAGVSFQQSQNPAQPSTQTYEKSVVTEQAIALPPEPIVVSRPVKTTTTERVSTTLGAAQKDTGREISAKLSSLKGVVWVGVLVFLFGAASAFYPPLKLIVGSTTTSAVACVAGLALIVLPSLVVGNEILMIAIGVGAVGLYWFSHRHATIHAELKGLKK